jgi:hypothetical protein
MASTVGRLESFGLILACGALIWSTFVYAAVVSNEEALHHRIVNIRLSTTIPICLIGCMGPWWDVSRRVMNVMEDVLSIYQKWTFSCNSQIKCSQTHVNTDTFSCSRYLETMPKNSYPPFIYTLYRDSLVVKALGYKPEGRGFETRWGEILNLPNPSGRTNPWGLLSL